MPLGKKVKTLVLRGSWSIAGGAGVDFPVYEADTHVWQDDVRVVAMVVNANVSVSDPDAAQAGTNEAVAYLGRGGSLLKPGELLMAVAMYHVLDTGILTLGGVGSTSVTNVLAYGNGEGMDFNEGDIIVLTGGGNASASSAGTVGGVAYACVHYVER